MEENLSNFVITDTSWSRARPFMYQFFICIIFITGGFPILFYIVFPVLAEGFIQVFFVPRNIIVMIFIICWGDFVLIVCIKIIYRAIKPIQKTKLSISREEFTIYIQNNVYLQIFLNQIEKIEIIKQRWDLPRKINLISPSVSKEVLLFLFIFKRKKQKLVFNYLKQIAESLNINLIERKEKFIDDVKIEEIREDIKNFIIYQAKL